MKVKKSIVYTVSALLLLVVAVVVGGSFYMLDYSLGATAGRGDERHALEGFVKRNPQLRAWADSLRDNKALRDTFITMPNGERQHAIFVRSPKAEGRTAVVVHGYTDRCYSMLNIASIYQRTLGYNIILPDLHAHGLSEGKDVQMGWNDRKDILHWTKVAERMFRCDGKTSQMVVHGVSMGAATTMCLSGDPTPDFIRCFVEDCGYTSVWDEFHHELGKRFGLPDFPLMYTTSALCKLRYGWSFGEASALKQVAKCRKPMLFIHGSKDDFVPTSMVYPLYEAKPQPKQLWIAPGSIHARSYNDHPAEYTRQVVGFVDKYVR